MKKSLFLLLVFSAGFLKPAFAKDDCLNNFAVSVNQTMLSYENKLRAIGESFLIGGRAPLDWGLQLREIDRARQEKDLAIDIAAWQLCSCDQSWCE